MGGQPIGIDATILDRSPASHRCAREWLLLAAQAFLVTHWRASRALPAAPRYS
jgi:hypothetical protein